MLSDKYSDFTKHIVDRVILMNDVATTMFSNSIRLTKHEQYILEKAFIKQLKRKPTKPNRI